MVCYQTLSQITTAKEYMLSMIEKQSMNCYAETVLDHIHPMLIEYHRVRQ